MHAPIAILSFDRPDLLTKVLKSLLIQSKPIDLKNVYLFQDSGSIKVQECVNSFRNIIPQGNLIVSEKNLGVALNFDRAERWMFDKLGAELAYFLEDDLVLGENYLEMLNQLSDVALSDQRIAYFAAYGNHRANLEEQKTRSTEVVPMQHKWGFGLTRRQWLLQQEILEPYLEIIRKRPYKERNHAEIRRYFERLGYHSEGTSQDAAKDVASCVLGTTKIMTFACFARYEGREGVHMRTDDYLKSGYDKTEVFPNATRLVIPSDGKIDLWIENSRESAKLGRRQRPPSEPYLQHPNRAGAFEKLSHDLFGKDPYEGFQSTITVPDLQGWNGLHPVLSRAVKDKKPNIIVDVGVWKGQSTITLAKAQSEAIDDGCVIAVDTFLGSPEHWTLSRPEIHQSLAFRHGRPSFYETFLSNVVLSGFQRKVLPLAQTSENAAHILRRHFIMADIVHIDAAHEYASALRDIEVWWELLRPGGLLIGDDFPWPGVARAVVHFTDKMNIPFQVEHPKWLIGKPA